MKLCVLLLLIFAISEGFVPNRRLPGFGRVRQCTNPSNPDNRDRITEFVQSTPNRSFNGHNSTITAAFGVGGIGKSWALTQLFASMVAFVAIMAASPLTSSAAYTSSFLGDSFFAGKSKESQSPLPADVGQILRDRVAMVTVGLRSGVTGEKVGQLRVGESLVNRLRAVERELDALEVDLFKEPADWDVLSVYPKILRAYSPLFTTYTDRAFPTSDPVDEALRYALRYEVGAMYSGVTGLEQAIGRESPRLAQRCFAKVSLAYDHYLKAGDLYEQYEYDDDGMNTEASASKYGPQYFDDVSNLKLSYVAPSIEAPGLQDDVVLLKGPDRGRDGRVLWISKGESGEPANVVLKLNARAESTPGEGTELKGEYSEGLSTHREVRTYPYAWLAKTTPPEVQFLDNLLAAYIASAVSSGVMYPIDTYKTRIQSGRRGIPAAVEGGVFRLWSGVFFFVVDANDAIYVASYGLLKPALLANVDVTNGLVVFAILTLAGSIGDAIGSVFRVFCEIIYKQIQAGTMTTVQGGSALVQNVWGYVTNDPITRRAVVLSWIAVLCRDMPFAGLQIALFDFYKGLFSFLDEDGVSTFIQRAIWGAFAGGTAAVLTTPFDLLTTNVMLEAESAEVEVMEKLDDEQENDWKQRPTAASAAANGMPFISPNSPRTNTGLYVEVVQIFAQTFRDLLKTGGPAALFTGAIPRLVFFAPAGMIFFATYESFFEVITFFQNNKN